MASDSDGVSVSLDMNLSAGHWSPVSLADSRTRAEVHLQNMLHPKLCHYFSLYIFKFVGLKQS